MEKVYSWLSLESYWATGRDVEIIQRSFHYSYPIGVYQGTRQVGVARIASDTATFAWLCDVFVDSEFRGRGIGTWLVEASLEWVRNNGIKRMILVTKDAHDVYARQGFEPLKNPDRWMEFDTRPQT
ncbi:MAG TPA: GNAT family N-acetyltransferase [archaeon]|nr:GNAT family N-acetyltransferase [archaeon]